MYCAAEKAVWSFRLLFIECANSQTRFSLTQHLCHTGDSTLVLTGAADQSAKLWDCETGVVISTYETPSSVRACGFCAYGNLMMFSTEDRKDVGCEIFLYDWRTCEPTARLTVDGPKVTSGLWGPFDEYLVTGHEDGSVCHYDCKVSKCSHRCIFGHELLYKFRRKEASLSLPFCAHISNAQNLPLKVFGRACWKNF